jgi:hypothetical protein
VTVYRAQAIVADKLEEDGFLVIKTASLENGLFNYVAIRDGKVVPMFIRDTSLLMSGERVIGLNAINSCRRAMMANTKSFIILLTRRSPRLIMIDSEDSFKRLSSHTLETIVDETLPRTPLENLVEEMVGHVFTNVETKPLS